MKAKETIKEIAPGVKELEAEIETKSPTPSVKSKDASDGFEKGFEHGFAKGMELSYTAAFADGVRHIVTLSENFMMTELKLPSREELVNSRKMPAWWMLALITAFIEGSPENLINIKEG